MRHLAPLLLLLTLVGALAGCGETTTSTYCTYHSDCPAEGARFCLNGVCQSDECRADRDCDEGETCAEGVCTE